MKSTILLSFVALFISSNAFSKNDFNKLLEDEKNSIEMYRKSVSSVVNVSNIKKIDNWFYGETEIPQGAGSGFIWDNEGHIVTNFHVIQEGDEFTVNFRNDSKPYKAKVVGAEPRKDIAVLKLTEKPKNLIPITSGSSNDLMVGQKTIAIGNPFALDHTMTVGIVSAVDRKITGIGGVKINGMIQTDASINPGNSGGPLLNSSGELIGMNTMIFSNSGSSAGLGFAVPVDTIKSIVPQLIKHGKVTRPGLGISIMDDSVKERLVRVGKISEKGIMITALDEKGPAGKAGLKGLSQDRRGQIYPGDIILSIDNKEVNTLDDIYQLFENYKVGDSVTIKYLRNEKIQNVSVKLDGI